MRITHKASLVLASAGLMLAWTTLPAMAASQGPTLMGPTGTVEAGSTVTYTLSDSGANASTEYQFWVDVNGHWMVPQNYSHSDTFTWHNVPAGSYQVVGYAMQASQLAAQEWSQAKSTGTDMIMAEPAATTVTLEPATGTLAAANAGLDPIQVRVSDGNGQALDGFSGMVTITDSTSLLWGPSNGFVSSVTVPITHGIGWVQVGAANAPTLDQIQASHLVSTPSDLTAASVQYLGTTVTSVAPGGSINSLNTVKTVASTVNASNHDMNPYGLTYDTYAGTSTAPNPYYQDLLVSNFSNAAGTNGSGSTIEAINPSTGKVSTFASNLSGPDALAVSPKGPIWVANFGSNGTGNDMVLTPGGGQFPNGGSVITSSMLARPWGQVFVPNPTTPAFFVTNALTGTLDAMYGFAPPNFSTDTKFAVIGQGLAHQGTTASTIKGPQGMVYDPWTHMVYVTDTQDNSIRAYSWNGAGTPNQGTGQLIYQNGALKAPVGITFNPLNGDLLVVNQGNNHLVEIRLNNGHAYVVGQKVLDTTPVNPITGAGSALFGVDALVNNGHLQVFFTNDNTNTVNVLE